jgi:hypothetical protein
MEISLVTGESGRFRNRQTPQKDIWMEFAGLLAMGEFRERVEVNILNLDVDELWIVV